MMHFAQLTDDATSAEMRETVKNLRAAQVKCGRNHLRYDLLSEDIDVLVDMILLAEMDGR